MECKLIAGMFIKFVLFFSIMTMATTPMADITGRQTPYRAQSILNLYATVSVSRTYNPTNELLCSKVLIGGFFQKLSLSHVVE